MKKINRRDVLKKVGFAALGSSILGSAACGKANEIHAPNINTSKKYQWKMVTTWLKGFPVLGTGAQDLADWIKEMSAGQLEIHVYGAKELVPAMEIFQTVSTGAVEMGHGSAYYWAGMVPQAQFFSTVPFGMNAQQMNAWLFHGGGLELWEKVYAEYNLIGMPAGNTGVQMGGWFNKKINTIEDYKGLKMRIPGLASKVLENVGGSPVLLAGGDIYMSLERGVIDATEWIGPYHDYLMKFHKIAKYYYSPGWHEPGTTLELMVNKPAFESLPKHLQQIIRSAAYRVNQNILSEFEAKNFIYMKKLIEEEKVQLKTFSHDILKKLKAVTDDIVNDLSKKNAQSKEIYQAYSKFHKGIKSWANYSEKAYYQM